MIDLNIQNEFSKLHSVVLGIGSSNGPKPNITETFDPRSLHSVKAGCYPDEKDIIKSLDLFKEILVKYGVHVFRPENIKDFNQVFARDISFVLDNKLIVPNIIPERSLEIQGLDKIISLIKKENILHVPNNVYVEGGDVVVHDNFVFVGYSKENDFATYKVARTNIKALDFLKSKFSKKNIIGFELMKSDVDCYNNALHLDCCFQPLGKNNILVCFDIFKNQESVFLIKDIFKSYNIIELDLEQMSKLNSNIFSISNEVVISDISFKEINYKLEKGGLIVEKIDYSEISKMGGLFRCSTLPLIRI